MAAILQKFKAKFFCVAGMTYKCAVTFPDMRSSSNGQNEFLDSTDCTTLFMSVVIWHIRYVVQLFLCSVIVCHIKNSRSSDVGCFVVTWIGERDNNTNLQQ